METIEKLVAEVLDGTELRLKGDTLTVEENLESGETRIRLAIHDQRTGERRDIEGRGVGLVDAIFHGLVDTYAQQFPSLKSIRFADFSIKAMKDSGRVAARSDMAAEATLRVANSESREFCFTHSSTSVTRSSVGVVLSCVSFFVNSERAFVALYRAQEHARTSGRPDSVARYTTQMATLVEATSYSEVIDGIRKTALKG